jgi:mono/diheme cytochrome c family protein
MQSAIDKSLRWIGLAALLAALAGAATAVAMGVFGAYNVAATEPHWRTTVRILEIGMRRSVHARAGDIAVPPSDDASRLRGASLYRTHCVDCHGAPGVAPRPFALGMVPLPANLTYTARAWPPKEMFWVIKHGIKMTGMPAWSFRLSDDDIWAVVAFLSAMAAMTPADYAAFDTPSVPRRTVAASAAEAPGTGDAARGRIAIHQYGCPTCHAIPGISAQSAPVGPPLEKMARRAYIAGVLPNTPENMVRWLRDPPAVDPRTAMPALGVDARDAVDMAAYLDTLR